MPNEIFRYESDGTLVDWKIPTASPHPFIYVHDRHRKTFKSNGAILKSVLLWIKF